MQGPDADDTMRMGKSVAVRSRYTTLCRILYIIVLHNIYYVHRVYLTGREGCDIKPSLNLTGGGVFLGGRHSALPWPSPGGIRSTSLYLIPYGRRYWS